MKTTLLVGLSLLLACAAPAGDDSKCAQYCSELKAVPAPELPAKATALLKNTQARERQAKTISVVQAAVKVNPVAAPTVVGAIAKAFPEMAAPAAAAAAGEQPAQAAAITYAAASAAPGQVGKIVAAVCRATPNSYRDVAVAAAKAVPGSGKQILRAVASVKPELKNGIEQTLASAGENVVVGNALPAQSSVIAARGPAVAPPFVPLSGTPVNTSPANSTDQQPGGRDYTKP